MLYNVVMGTYDLIYLSRAHRTVQCEKGTSHKLWTWFNNTAPILAHQL